MIASVQQSLERHSLIVKYFNYITTWDFQERQVQQKHSQRSLKRFLCGTESGAN